MADIAFLLPPPRYWEDNNTEILAGEIQVKIIHFKDYMGPLY